MGIFNNLLTAPRKEDGHPEDMVFSFDDLLSYYAEFEFNGGTTEAASHLMDLEFEVDSMSGFTERILSLADLYADNFVQDYAKGSAKEGPEDTLQVDLLDGNGDSIGLVTVDVWINESLSDLVLPNGDKLQDMAGYGWKQFKELEQMAKDYEAAKSAEDDFTKNVEGITGPDGPDSTLGQ